MTVVAAARRGDAPARLAAVGPLGRLGGWTADHVRTVAIVWAVGAVALGVFAPKVETALSGAGWQANGSESVRARTLIQRNFAGLSSSALMVVVHSQRLTAGDAAFRQTVSRVDQLLRANAHVASVQPHAGSSISADGHTALVTAGAKGDPTAMVAAADALKSKLKAAGAPGVSVSLTGASGMWSDFNTANRNAMMRSELFSWPVTMAILVLAFGSLVAAGLPLLLTILGLVASAGLLTVLTHGFEISIWAMNFALMFALALGIDYALFVVHRFRGAFFGSRLSARDAVAVTMDTAGKAVPLLRPHRADLALGGDARPQPGLPLDGARDHAQRRLRARRDTDAAARRAREARPEGRRDPASLGAFRRAPLRALRTLGRPAVAPPTSVRSGRHADPRPARASAHRTEDGDAIDQGRPRKRRLKNRLHAGAAGLRHRCAGRAPDRPAHA